MRGLRDPSSSLRPFELEPHRQRRRARRAAASPTTAALGASAASDLDSSRWARRRIALDEVSAVAQHVTATGEDYRRLSEERTRVEGELAEAERAHAAARDRRRERLERVDATYPGAAAGSVDAAGSGAAAAGPRETEPGAPRRSALLAVLLVVVKGVVFAAEAVFTAASAQLTGLSGWQLPLFAVGTTAALFAGASFVADVLHDADAGSGTRRRHISLGVAAATLTAMLLTAFWLAALRQAFAEALFAEAPQAGLVVSGEALHAVGRIGIALLVVVVGLDYGLRGRSGPRWGRLLTRVGEGLSRSARRGRIGRLDRADLREARRRRDERRARLADLDERQGRARVDLAFFAPELVRLVGDAGLAESLQAQANAALLHDFAQVVVQARVPWSQRLLARLRGVRQVQRVELPWPEPPGAAEADVLARARRAAALAVDTLEDLGFLSPERAGQLRDSDPLHYVGAPSSGLGAAPLNGARR